MINKLKSKIAVLLVVAMVFSNAGMITLATSIEPVVNNATIIDEEEKEESQNNYDESAETTKEKIEESSEYEEEPEEDATIELPADEETTIEETSEEETTVEETTIEETMVEETTVEETTAEETATEETTVEETTATETTVEETSAEETTVGNLNIEKSTASEINNEVSLFGAPNYQFKYYFVDADSGWFDAENGQTEIIYNSNDISTNPVQIPKIYLPHDATYVNYGWEMRSEVPGTPDPIADDVILDELVVQCWPNGTLAHDLFINPAMHDVTGLDSI